MIEETNALDRCTPGEWKALPYYYEPENGVPMMLIGLGKFDTIAEVRHDHDDLGGEVLANAHMLAASKEMYAALRALAAGDIDVSGTALIYDADPRKLLSAAREALRSAEGWS